MEIVRPFDVLNDTKGKEIIITLKNSEVYKGKLKAFDVHLNLVLSDVTEMSSEKEEKTQQILIRGDAIVTIKNV